MIPPSSGCGDEEGNVFSISGKAKVTGGTKLYKKATGTLKLTGVYDRGAGTLLDHVQRKDHRPLRRESGAKEKPMRRAFLILAVAGTAVVVTAVGGAQTPTEVPFPSPKVVQYFVSAQTVSSTGELTNYFKQGSTVTFRAFATETKTGNLVTPGRPEVLQRHGPGPEGRQAVLQGDGCQEASGAVAVDGHVDDSCRLPGRCSSRSRSTSSPSPTGTAASCSSPLRRPS